MSAHVEVGNYSPCLYTCLKDTTLFLCVMCKEPPALCVPLSVFLTWSLSGQPFYRLLFAVLAFCFVSDNAHGESIHQSPLLQELQFVWCGHNIMCQVHSQERPALLGVAHVIVLMLLILGRPRVFPALVANLLFPANGKPLALYSPRAENHQQGKEPEYLDYNIKGRGFWERMPYNAGALYITGEKQAQEGDMTGRITGVHAASEDAINTQKQKRPRWRSRPFFRSCLGVIFTLVFPSKQSKTVSLPPAPPSFVCWVKLSPPNHKTAVVFVFT